MFHLVLADCGQLECRHHLQRRLVGRGCAFAEREISRRRTAGGHGHFHRLLSAVRAAFPAATLVRPALVYGPDDHFFTRFAPLVRRSPAIPLIGGGRTRFQPMHVDDVAETMARMLDEPASAGRIA